MTSTQWLLTGYIGCCIAGIGACGGTPATEAPDPLRSYSPTAVAMGEILDYGAAYRQMGLVASGPPISFVGSTAFFATPSPDTTFVVLSLSLPNRGLTFSPEGKSYEAVYSVLLQLLHDTSEIRRVHDVDTVRVGSFKETSRTDESIIFRRTLRLPPGEYRVTYTVQDGTAGREATQTAAMIVPRFLATSVSRPVLVYGGPQRTRLDEIPQYLPKPRASVTLGVDRTVNVYLEVYGTRMTTPVLFALRNGKDAVVWRDTMWLAQRKEFASGILAVPVTQGDPGMLMLSVVRPGNTDTVWTPLFMGFGPDLPAISFNEMVDYLRFFTTASWIHRLYKASPATHGAVWAAFLQATDSAGGTSHQALRDYFGRIRTANALFRNDPSAAAQGWLSDRGSVFVGLGEPDNAYEQDAYGGRFSPLPGGRIRLLVWEYRAFQARIIFSDETGTGQWRLLPSSALVFERLVTLKLAG